jgi:hypothetical protein
MPKGLSVANRDDFSSAVRSALALRAAYHCSICDRPTIGPSDESPTATSNIGTASHICAAAPGGRRFDPSMTPEDRSGVGNGIWLCANHGRLVDTDDVTYTVGALREFKVHHERRCQLALGSQPTTSAESAHLLAIGPGIVCVGDIDQVQGMRWRLRIDHFVIGSFADLVSLAGALPSIPAYDRYVVVNSLGEGRSLADGLSIERRDAQIVVVCNVAAAFPRTRAADLPTDLALSAKHDLFVENGQIATVSGLSALPQKLLTNLSMRRRESPFHTAFGSRLAEYWTNFVGSPWLGELMKLDVIRLASIPYADPVLGQSYTPLQCVERVNSVQVVGDLADRRLPVRLDLQIAGLGAWSRELAVHVA